MALALRSGDRFSAALTGVLCQRLAPQETAGFRDALSGDSFGVGSLDGLGGGRVVIFTYSFIFLSSHTYFKKYACS